MTAASTLVDVATTEDPDHPRTLWVRLRSIDPAVSAELTGAVEALMDFADNLAGRPTEAGRKVQQALLDDAIAALALARLVHR